MAPLPLPLPRAGSGAQETLPRARRVRKRREFVRIQESSVRVTTRNLLMLLALQKEDGPSRLGVVASRKVGPAVARNRAKRLVREAFRRNPDVFPPRLDVVIVIRPGTHRLAQGDLDEQMRRARPSLARRAAELAAAGRTIQAAEGAQPAPGAPQTAPGAPQPAPAAPQTAPAAPDDARNLPRDRLRGR